MQQQQQQPPSQTFNLLRMQMTGEQDKQGRARLDVGTNAAPGAKTSNPYAIDVVRLRKKELSRGIINTEQLLESLVEHGVLSYDKRMALSTLRTREERNTRMLEMVARSGERACRLFFHPCLKQAEPELYSTIRRYVGEVSRQVGDSRRQLIGYLLERDNGSLEEFENGDDPPSKVKVITRKPRKMPVGDAPPPKVEKPAQEPEPPPPQSQPEVLVVTDEATFKAAIDGDLAYFERASLTSGDMNKMNERKETLLHLAAAQGHASLAEFLLKKGAKFNMKDVNGRTALHAAAENGQDAVLRLLLSAGADVYTLDNKGENAAELALRNNHTSAASVLVEHEKTRRDRRKHLIHMAALKNESRVVATLLQCGANVASPDEKDRTALYYAVTGGFTETVQVLLAAGAKCDHDLVDVAFDANNAGMFELLLLSHALGEMSDEAKARLLFKAVERGFDGTVLALLKQGADPNVADAGRSSYTPLLLAAEMGHTDVALVLLEQGARVDVRTSDSSSALHLASSKGHLSTVQLLLGKGLAVGVAGHLERTALHSAAAEGHLAVAELLLREGAKVGAAGRDGATPLHLAVESGYVEVARLLVKNGADPGTKDKKGKTPLHLSAMGGDVHLLEVLLEEKRADVNVADGEKKTPLHLAAGHGHASAVSLLLARGAKAFSRDMDGNAALHFAAAAGSAETTGVLLEAGRAGKTNSKRKSAADERNTWRKTPLHIAAETGRPELVELLLKSGGASLNALDNSRDTPLHCAVRGAHVAAARLLAGWAEGPEKPNLFAANALDKTPLQLAEAGDTDGHREIATLLRKKMRII
ncbi:CARD- and ANK-domain containing inflammasome adapter protein-like [Lampetra fluviatilis]